MFLLMPYFDARAKALCLNQSKSSLVTTYTGAKEGGDMGGIKGQIKIIVIISFVPHLSRLTHFYI
jgi:hypothetical protein